MNRCFPIYRFRCQFGNVAQTFTEGDYEATTPADTVFTPNQSSSNCIALQLAKDEVLDLICENTIPVADPQELETASETPLDITLTGSSEAGNFLFYEITTDPSHGTLFGSGDSYTYTPAPLFTGTDSFEFTVSNGSNTSTPATVTIEVLP